MSSSQHEIKKSLNEAQQVLQSFLADEKNFTATEQAAKLMVQAVQSGNKVISCGNGGSMSDAMHFAEELTGRFREDRAAIPAIAISDPAYITCTGNDYGFANIFSRFIQGVGKQGDVLLAISTSGNSANIINAAEAARAKGMKVVALTGNNGGKLAGLADAEVRVPHTGFSDRIQEMHIKIIHILIQLIEKELAE